MIPTTNPWHEAVAPLWRRNLAFAQLLGLCPLLAVTTSLVNGLALGLASAAVVTVASVLMALLGRALVPALRVPLSLLTLAVLVTCVDLFTEALLYDLHELLGLFVPLIAVNSGLVAQAGNSANHRSVVLGLVSGLATGLGFLFALMTLGGLREIVGRGTLFAGVELLAGESSRSLTLDLPFDGMLVAVLPPGAFFGMAVLLALRKRLAARAPAAPALAEPPAAGGDPP